MRTSGDATLEKPRKKFVLVDDQPVWREGIAQWILTEPGWEVCFQAKTAEQAFDAVLRTKPDIVITDIALPRKSGLELVRDIRAVMPQYQSSWFQCTTKGFMLNVL